MESFEQEGKPEGGKTCYLGKKQYKVLYNYQGVQVLWYSLDCREIIVYIH